MVADDDWQSRTSTERQSCYGRPWHWLGLDFFLLLFCIKDRYLLILVEGFECHQDPVGLGWSGLPGKVAIVFGGRERLPFSTLVLWSYG